ncbi:MAG: CsgG/HfaB family protein [Candidatus Omnitrophica bacterium]|nr:CsgG/HfaB family protein [Candidatus Omnitrophota bacterium]
MKSILTVFTLCVFLFSANLCRAGEYKPTVTVYGFEVKASSGFWHDAKWDIGSGMGEMLIDALVNTDKFNVVERLNLSDITTEQDLVTKGRVSKKTGAKTAELKGAEYIVRGTITEFSYKESGGGLGLNIKGFNLGGTSSEAHIAGTIRIFDSTTGEICGSKRFERKVPATGLTIGYQQSGIGGNLAGFKQTPLGKATNMAIADMTGFISEKIPSCPPTQEESSGLSVCPKCGNDIDNGAKFCAHCGLQLEGLICPKCGRELSPGTNFCQDCGTRVQSSQQ